MKLTRKEFLKVSAGAALTAGSGLSFLTSCSRENSGIKHDRKTAVSCPFCAAGCSLNLYMLGDRPVFITGDENDPVTEGYLCGRAFSLIEVFNSRPESKTVRYRAPFSETWEDISYETAVSRVSEKIKKTRDASFIDRQAGVDVNRLETVAAVAGGSLTNEELFSFSRFCRIIGISEVGSDQLIKSDAKNRVLRQLLGYGAEPNPVHDIENSDIIFMLGADPAEDSGIYMKYIEKAKRRGAEVINADVLYSKTAILSDHFIQLTPASDLVLLNGIIHFILNNDQFNREYIVRYTEAGNILHREFSFNTSTGTFSGFSPASASYNDRSSWSYELDKRGNPQTDDELRDPKSAISILKSITSGYSPSVVKNTCGIDPDLFLRIAELIGNSVSKNRRMSFVLGSGVLDQNQADSIVHAVVMIQLLLGNIGLPGGGIYSVEKLSGYQSLSDFIPDWNSLPGDIPLPIVNEMRKDLSFKAYAYNNRSVSNYEESVNYYSAFENISSSLLRALYGSDMASEYVYKWLPKSGGRSDASGFLTSLGSGKYRGALLLNPGFDAFLPASDFLGNSLRRLDWSVVVSGNENVFTDFWKKNPSQCATELFCFPSAISPWKNGTVTNISRKIKRLNPVSESALPDCVRIFADIHGSLKTSYSAGDGAFPEPVNMSAVIGSVRQVTEIISGTDRGRKINSGFELNSESSVCGNHFYAGIMRDRKKKVIDFSESRSNKKNGELVKLDNGNGYNWPSNAVYLYNKIASDVFQTELNDDISDRKKDVTDGLERVAGKKPFIMMSAGKASFLLPESVKAPFPVYYDYLEQTRDVFPFPFRIQGSVQSGRTRGRRVYVLFLNRTNSSMISDSKLFEQFNGKNLIYVQNSGSIPGSGISEPHVLHDSLLLDTRFLVLKNVTDVSDFTFSGHADLSMKSKQIILNITENI